LEVGDWKGEGILRIPGRSPERIPRFEARKRGARGQQLRSVSVKTTLGLRLIVAMLARARSTEGRFRNQSPQGGGASVSLTQTGFQVQSIREGLVPPRVFQWREIKAIVAYKRDCFAYDLLCLAVEDASGVIEICEQDDGWDDFIKALGTNLPGSVPRENWWPQVVQPPFATNPTVVYRRGKPAQ